MGERSDSGLVFSCRLNLLVSKRGFVGNLYMYTSTYLVNTSNTNC